MQRATYHRAPMSAALPDRVDVARQVQARRIYEGTLPFIAMPRLCGLLATSAGEARYHAQFDRDDLGVDYLGVRVDCGLPLVCQRTLEVFTLPVQIDERLGLIVDERDEAALPAGYEPLLVEHGTIDLAAVIEDELILAVPVVPTQPGAALDWVDGSTDEAAEAPRANPFAVLAGLKKDGAAR